MPIIKQNQLKSSYSVVVIGGGQAGLSMSYYLQANKIEHLVIDQTGSASCPVIITQVQILKVS